MAKPKAQVLEAARRVAEEAKRPKLPAEAVDARRELEHMFDHAAFEIRNGTPAKYALEGLLDQVVDAITAGAEADSDLHEARQALDEVNGELEDCREKLAAALGVQEGDLTRRGP